MPATPLYTISVHASGKTIFHLTPEAVTQALQSERAEYEKQNSLYKLYLATDSSKDSVSLGAEHAIVLGEDSCTVYEPGKPARVVIFPNLKELMGADPRAKIQDPIFKKEILTKLIGTRNFIQDHIAAYRSSTGNPAQIILIELSEGQYGDEKFKTLADVAPDKSEKLYEYEVTQEGDQLTLLMNIPEDTGYVRGGLAILKHYATALLATVKNPNNPAQWPKLVIQGEGVKTLHGPSASELSSKSNDNVNLLGYSIGALLVGILGIGIIAALSTSPLVIPWIFLTPMLIGGGILGIIGSIINAFTPFKFPDSFGHELNLLSDLRLQNLDNAVAGKLYLDNDGGYVLRNTANGLRHGKMEQDKIAPDKWTELLNGKSLKSQLNNPEFKKAILEITTAKGYTCDNVHQRDLADQYAAYFAKKATPSPSASANLSSPSSVAIMTTPSTGPVSNPNPEDPASKNIKPKSSM